MNANHAAKAVVTVPPPQLVNSTLGLLELTQDYGYTVESTLRAVVRVADVIPPSAKLNEELDGVTTEAINLVLGYYSDERNPSTAASRVDEMVMTMINVQVVQAGISLRAILPRQLHQMEYVGYNGKLISILCLSGGEWRESRQPD